MKDRVQGTNCPHCFPPTSIPELRIFCELQALFPSALHRAAVQGNEVDIYIPELQVGIEYDGIYWHKGRIDRDLVKNKALKSTILLIRIREHGLPDIPGLNIQLQQNKHLKITTIKQILESILKHRTIESQETILRVDAYFGRTSWLAPETFNRMQSVRNISDYDKSISYLFPQLASEWHPTKNGALRPEYFGPGSDRKVWWQDRRGREWEATISSRVSNKRARTLPASSGLFD